MMCLILRMYTRQVKWCAWYWECIQDKSNDALDIENVYKTSQKMCLILRMYTRQVKWCA